MADVPAMAALYPAQTRLLVGLVIAALFALVVPKRTPHPMALAVTTVFVAVWLFGATLIWGSPAPTKLRLGVDLTAWQGHALLACAAVGVLSAAAALRMFARHRRVAGGAYAAVFLLAFAAWSAVVRYPVGLAVAFLLIAVITMVFASAPGSPPKKARTASYVLARGPGRALLTLAAAATPVLAGVGFRLLLGLVPACDASLGWLLLTFVPLLLLSGSFAWIGTRATGKGHEAAAAAVLASGFVAAAACVIGFLFWFGANQCGE